MLTRQNLMTTKQPCNICSCGDSLSISPPQYQQQLKEDYESLEWYNSYWDYVEQKNGTDTNLGYQTRFMTVRSRNNLLLNSMTTLVSNTIE